MEIVNSVVNRGSKVSKHERHKIVQNIPRVFKIVALKYSLALVNIARKYGVSRYTNERVNHRNS